MPDNTKPLSLTGMEVVFLSDLISGDSEADELPKHKYVCRQLLLLLGSAYLELVDRDGISVGPVDLCVTEEMGWIMHSRTNTGDMGIDGKTNIGVGLLLKLYTLLEAFNNEVAGFPVGGEDEDMDEMKRYTLKIVRDSDA